MGELSSQATVLSGSSLERTEQSLHIHNIIIHQWVGMNDGRDKWERLTHLLQYRKYQLKIGTPIQKKTTPNRRHADGWEQGSCIGSERH